MSQVQGRREREAGAPLTLSGQGKSFDAMAMYAFVALGLPDGMIGTAWPAVRRGFHAPLEDLGVVLLVGTFGAIASSSVAGLVLGRLGIKRMIMLAGTIGALGAVGIILSPVLWAFVLSGTGLGIAAGFLDSAVNTAVALANRNRLLNMLHGCYGVGTTIGPLVITAALLAGSWRPGYGVLLAVELFMVAGWWLAGRRLEARPPLGPVPAEEVRAGRAPAVPRVMGPALSRRRAALTVALGLLVFMVYTGFEVSAGQWEPSFDRGPLHLGTGATGLATFGYWGALTVARFALAAPRRPLSQAGIVRWGCVVALGGAAVVWWRPSTVVSLLGLVVIGGALAGVFPALVALTPSRVGEEMARHAIGWQIGAANIGGSAISAVFGAIFQHYSLNDFGPALVVVAVLVLLGALVLERAAPARLGD
ncbi:MAG: MFS transporter [Acidimicrobiales bacterium]